MLRPQEMSALPGTARPPEPRFSTPATHENDWRRQLAGSVRTVSELLDRLGISPEAVELPPSPLEFPLLVPDSFVQRMQPGNPDDPLLRQVLPTAAEAIDAPGFQKDALAEADARTASGLLHKYPGRVLLIAHGSCAVHCRYCFRRHYPYAAEPRSLADWQPAFDAIAADDSIHEVLLSGGDPLVLSDRRLGEMTAAIEAIPHVRRLRIHTRLPIVLPARVTESFLALLTSTRLRTIVVVHANHARELVADCSDALQRMVAAGVPLLNQAVLLRGVNDSVEALAELYERCADLGVTAYYLHQLDRVRGAQHFETPEAIGQRLMAALRERLPGYATPRYVVEIPGRLSKTPLF